MVGFLLLHSSLNYMNATTTITGRLINDLTASGLSCTMNFADADPGAAVDYEVKTMTCSALAIQNGQAVTNTSNSSSSPFYVQDSGIVSFGLGLIITILFLMVIGMIFNSMTNKKEPFL